MPRAEIVGVNSDIHGKRSCCFRELTVGMSVEMPSAVVGKTARRLPAKQIIGSAILPASSRVREEGFFAGVAQWEERGPRKSVIGVRIAAPAPLV